MKRFLVKNIKNYELSVASLQSLTNTFYLLKISD